jgi:hypothetical protein
VFVLELFALIGRPKEYRQEGDEKAAGWAA